ncbi:hypothetical protein OIU79_019523 [Salix purpurea]|uniref:Uncharacterized protein n=1 Tax=Salix purpurea TaxID=77065 RepID=A0A9Q0SK53_SALPP|nr:hypothetical protein OIU79_019523 [Salix purpurea]
MNSAQIGILKQSHKVRLCCFLKSSHRAALEPQICLEILCFRAAFVASCLRGALPPVDFLAVCFVRAIEISGFGGMGLRGYLGVFREK